MLDELACLTVRVCVPDCSVAALGVSLAVAFANTPTVGRLLSTIPMASYPTSGPRSLLTHTQRCLLSSKNTTVNEDRCVCMHVCARVPEHGLVPVRLSGSGHVFSGKSAAHHCVIMMLHPPPTQLEVIETCSITCLYTHKDCKVFIIIQCVLLIPGAL